MIAVMITPAIRNNVRTNRTIVPARRVSQIQLAVAWIQFRKNRLRNLVWSSLRGVRLHLSIRCFASMTTPMTTSMTTDSAALAKRTLANDAVSVEIGGMAIAFAHARPFLSQSDRETLRRFVGNSSRSHLAFDIDLFEPSEPVSASGYFALTRKPIRSHHSDDQFGQ